MQSWALLVDSYRLVMSRKLFWISLIISAVVVLIYASIGFGEAGWSMFFGAVNIDSVLFRAGSPLAKQMYLGIFSYFVIGMWLTWAATILALFSTAPIFVDFMSDGAIDLVLSKPISRVKVFFVKFLGGLMFVVLQVAVFSAGVFLCVAWRVGDWNWSIFAAIPLVAVFFSYLYAFNVLMNVLTRSAVASLLLTMLFWFVIYAVQQAEVVLNMNRLSNEITAEALEAQGKPQEAQKRRDSARNLVVWHDRVNAVLAVLPKTGQTIGLLDRWISDDSQFSFAAILRGVPQRERGDQRRGRSRPQRPEDRLEEDARSRPAWKIIGSSVIFEALVLLLACWIFVRRDF